MNNIDNLILRYPVLSAVSQNIKEAFHKILDSINGGGKLMICGNGGSASDAEHIVGELMKEFSMKRPIDAATAQAFIESGAADLVEKLQGAIPAISLNSQTSLLTAIANDIDADMMFAQQVYGYGKAGDVLLAMSTSGNSNNVLHAVRAAKAMDIKTILVSGKNGGKIREIADVAICLPESETFKVQELTLPIYHAICLELENTKFMPPTAIN